MKKKPEARLLNGRLFAFLAAWGVLFALLFLLAFSSAWGSAHLFGLGAIAAAAAVLAVLGYFFLWKPYREATRSLAALAANPTPSGLNPVRWYYNPQCALLAKRLSLILQDTNSFELSKRQAQYLALQNQINPHFLYNTLESIRSEALISGLASVADMCEALSSFFRYTISNQENLVSLEEEIENIKTYFYIQQYRFGTRLHLRIEYEEPDLPRLLKCQIPKLTLQPIVENAIIHGIEQKVGEGTVTVRLTLTERCVLIKISDDGSGMDPETLEKINRRIATGVLAGSGKGGIAIGNVNTRIKLLFGNTYGVTVYSTLGVGTDVEITLPCAPRGNEGTPA